MLQIASAWPLSPSGRRALQAMLAAPPAIRILVGAAVVHLCGAGPGDAYARRGFQLTAGQRCGDHDAGGYLALVNALKRQFVRLAAAG